MSTNAESNVLVLGSGFTIDGDVRGAGTILLGGTVKGSISAETVKITPSGQVFGVIECAQLDIAGKLDGSFNGEDVIVREGAVIQGNKELVSKGTCLVSGSIHGALKSNNLKVEKEGALVGAISANQLDTFGNITGSVVGVSVIVRNGAVVDGSIHYGNLAMESGSDVTGQIERKHRANISPAVATQTITVDFPENLIQELRKYPVAGALKAGLANGGTLPSWMFVDQERFQLVLQRSALDDLVARGQTVRIGIEVGDEIVSFTLPPEKK
jgi:cytoskeletal protein CcmA (bactofilin family)